MANTPNLDLENVNVLLDTEYAYNQIVSEIIAKINNNNLKIDELPNDFISSSQKGAVNGVATLGSDGIIPKEQLPIDSGSVERVMDITARDAMTNLYDNKLVFVIDATGDTTVTTGWAMYIYSTSSLNWTKIVDGESLDLQLTWDNITNKPTVFPPDTHTHEQIQTNTNDIVNLQNNKVNKIEGSRLVSETEITVFNDKYSKVEIDNKLSLLETNIDWKESVATFVDIATTYPNPIDGWTVNVNDTDITYRYNGTDWIAISANAIPKATTSVDGLMSKEDKAQLDQNKTDILTIQTQNGTEVLTTMAQTLSGAINEHEIQINSLTAETTNKTITVGVGKNFSTIQAAINSLKKRIDATITINVDAGTYNEVVNISGFSGGGIITINGGNSIETAVNYKVNNFIITANTIRININGFEAITTSAISFKIDNSVGVTLQYCRSEAVTTDANYGMQLLWSSVYCTQCLISNKPRAVSSEQNSKLLSRTWTAGTGNVIGLLVATGGEIVKVGTQPAGTTAESVLTGGLIRS